MKCATMRINKNYYNFSFGKYCGVIVNEKTMRKISALQAKTYDALMQILKNDDDIHVSSWSIADEPKEISQSERTFNYSDDESPEFRLGALRELFGIEKIDDLYFVKGMYTDSRIQAKKEHEQYLESISPKATITKEE